MFKWSKHLLCAVLLLLSPSLFALILKLFPYCIFKLLFSYSAIQSSGKCEIKLSVSVSNTTTTTNNTQQQFQQLFEIHCLTFYIIIKKSLKYLLIIFSEIFEIALFLVTAIGRTYISLNMHGREELWYRCYSGNFPLDRIYILPKWWELISAANRAELILKNFMRNAIWTNRII